VARVSQGTLSLAVGTSVVHTVTVTVGRACGLYIWRLFLSGQFLCSLHAEKTRRLGPKAAEKTRWAEFFEAPVKPRRG
jgi:hypothetical protein